MRLHVASWLLLIGLGGVAWAAQSAFEEPSLARGQNAFKERCIRCHPGTKPLDSPRTRLAWADTVDRMAQKHLRAFVEEVSPSDKAAIVDYLALNAAAPKAW